MSKGHGVTNYYRGFVFETDIDISDVALTSIGELDLVVDGGAPAAANSVAEALQNVSAIQFDSIVGIGLALNPSIQVISEGEEDNRGSKQKKIAIALSVRNLDDTEYVTVESLDSQRRYVILIDESTGEVKKGGPVTLNVDNNSTGNEATIIDITGETMGSYGDNYQRRTF